MASLPKRMVLWSRNKRSKWFEPLGKFFLKLRIKAWHLTILAFILGAVAVYFLFRNHLYFAVFGILHIIFDGLDGVLARVSKPTKFGAYLDYTSDQLILVLVLIKSYFYFNDYFVLIVLGIFVLHNLIHMASDLKGKVIYCRTAALIIYFFGFLGIYVYMGGYFLVGILSLYGLTQQFNDFLRKKFTT